jgi:ubiquinol oxidase
VLVFQLNAFTTDANVERRPKCATLYDVFRNIRDDEVEHELTMESCQVNELPKMLKAKDDRLMDSLSE